MWSATRALSRLSLVSIVLSSLFYVASTSPLPPHQVEELFASQRRHARRQDSIQVVTGIQQFGIQPRLEIRQLEKNVDQFNIYLLGLVKFHATNQTDKLSYYNIAGIHGRPYQPWDDVEPGDGPGSPGFCTHVSNIFLPWHRPYLALYEQILYQHIIEAVNEFPAGAIRQRYASAALSWRHPYWDWAAEPPAGESVLPTSISSPNITVTMPNGTATIPNPLYSYHFQWVTVADFYYSPFAEWNYTMRAPTDWTSMAYSQDDLVAQALDNGRTNFQERLYGLFTNYNNFTQFGNEAWQNNTLFPLEDSLESLHDVIHSITGSRGHMTYLDYSAFDPLFWLHHTMIDRSFALWQAIYNDSYVEPMAAVDPTFTVKTGTVLDVNTPLVPFHSNANGDFWTSATARSVRSFGYTYADLGNGSVDSIKANINKLYGGSAGSGSPTRLKRETPGEDDTHIDAPKEIVDGKYQEYLANIVSQKFALDGSYAIYVFMGTFNDTPSAWPLAPNLVGTHGVFAGLSSPAGARARSKADTGIAVTGTVPLTSALLAKVQSGELPCMDVPTVTAYLNENLHWRVGMYDGSSVPPEDTADLMITVVSAEVEPPSSTDSFPSWSGFTLLTNVTEGKPGGC